MTPSPSDPRTPSSRVTGLLVAYWLAIFLLTHLPLPHVPQAPDHTDKLVHAAMYAGLAFLLALRGVRPWAAWLVAVVCAAGDELTQHFVPSRTGDPLDALADAVGAALGLAAFATVFRQSRDR